MGRRGQVSQIPRSNTLTHLLTSVFGPSGLKTRPGNWSERTSSYQGDLGRMLFRDCTLITGQQQFSGELHDSRLVIEALGV